MTSIPEAHYRVSIKGVIKDVSGCILLTQKKGKRDFPGGGIDHGETHGDACKREIQEEMNLKVLSVGKNPNYFETRLTKGGRNIANVMYDVIVEDLNFTPSEECEEIAFFSIEEISNMNENDTYPQIINRAKNMQNK